MKKGLVALAACLALIVAAGCYWVFALGAVQPDGPVAAPGTRPFELLTYQSRLLGMPRQYALFLPPGYTSHPERRYPTIYLLHGGHGQASDWFIKGDAGGVIDRLYRSGALPESIVVAPDGNDRRGSSPFFDPDYVDGPNGRVLSAIGSELVQLIDQRYRTIPDPRLRAIGGLSSGGWGAFNIGLHYPTTFSVLFSHSGYFHYSGSGDRSINSPALFVDQLSPAKLLPLAFYLDAGRQDGEFLSETKQFARQLARMQLNVTFHAYPGGHGLVGPDAGWNYWHKHLADSLTLVGTRFKQALAQDARR
ncbi:alpha/beta hydrolase [Gloeobacter kilaueensis]|uniref:Esterase n=1 Tax=Gloeobacter kilaueensis (strain ATCC BAA-2537 / CCAP 1431/1 / ULC 316 / JS1) TaxID=1183438 RepID=U5QIR7_GLOK1|nr:alpha/beta hydrolase-fold protein [Gloeobacter kilaueensis]AGY57575.1 esterase [Gloeobacter kilaueensis JS1]